MVYRPTIKNTARPAHALSLRELAAGQGPAAPRAARRAPLASCGAVVLLCTFAWLLGCEQVRRFGLQTQAAEDASGKYGVSSLTLSADGAYVLQWDIPEEIAASSEVDGSFEIYLAQVSSVPASFVPLPGETGQGGGEAGSGRLPGVSLGNLAPADTPVGKGAILTTVKGARSYTVTADMVPPTLFLFQVRYVTSGAAVDANTRVLVYNPNDNAATFGGVSGLTRTSSGKMLLSWDALVVANAQDEKATSYQVLLQSSRDEMAKIIAEGTIVSGLRLTLGGDESIGQLVDFPANSVYVTRGSMIGEVKGTPQFELTNGLSDGLTYILRVQAKTGRGSIGTSTRAVVYRPSKLFFAGLKNTGVKLRNDLTAIDLSWDAAQDPQGAVIYQIYGNGNFLGSTAGTMFQVPSPLPGRTYSFYVMAQDAQSALGSAHVVSVVVPVPASYEGCLQAQATGSTSMRVSYRFPLGADRVGVYRDGVHVGSGTSAINVSYVDTGLSPSTSYTYTCRVVYGSKAVDGTTSVQATTAGAFSFGGLTPSGITVASDASTIVLAWTAASNPVGPVTYYVYDDAPTFANTRVQGSTSGTTYTISNPTRGRSYTLGVRAKDNSGFESNTSFAVATIPQLTGAAPFTTPEIQEAKWSDGTAKIKITLAAGSLGTFRVYMSNAPDLSSFDLTTPWEVGTYQVFTTGTTPYIYVGGKGRTFSGDNYFIVREGTTGDANTTVTNKITLPVDGANFARVPTTSSRLAYDYYIGTFEASLASGIFDAADRIATSEAALTTCSYQFHVNGAAFHSSCGVKASTARAVHSPKVTPVQATWHQAYVACRNASQDAVTVRLPTPEEWRRASRWSLASYAQMWRTYADNSDPLLCATSTSGSVLRATGLGTSCLSTYGLYDMAGNTREWVDARMVPYGTPPAEGRGGLTPTVARLLMNGIDAQTQLTEVKDTPRFRGILPDANQLALLMGSDSVLQANAYDPKLFEPESESWEDPTLQTSGDAPSRGFRCVAFPNKKLVPTMAQLALPTPPTYPVGASVIPPGQYAHDTVLETTAHDSGTQSFTVTWLPWQKTVCNPSCTPNTSLSYEVYRYKEPTRIETRTRISWALQHGPYATLPTSITGTDGTGMPLDPIFVAANGVALCTAETAMCRLVATIPSSQCNPSSTAGCTFTDRASTGFDWSSLYRYVIVVKDSEGNAVTPEIQRFAAPFLAGPLSHGGTAAFRREIRWRRAGGFLLDAGPQQMTFVSMNDSGLDHDLFIQKFPASAVGVIGTDSYPPYPSPCRESLVRTGALASTYCGTATWPSVSLESSSSGTPLTGASQGAGWFGCTATEVTANDSTKYRLYLPSDAEWLAATTAASHGASAEWTAGRVDTNGQGLDNGLDGLWLSVTRPHSTGAPAGLKGSASGASLTLTPWDPTSGGRVRCAL